MARGGKRPGAGRKTGSKAAHTVEAQEQKKIIIEMLGQNIRPIICGLIRRAIKGDSFAARELFDRAYGKPKQEMDVKGESHRPILVMHGGDDRLLRVMRERGLLKDYVVDTLERSGKVISTTE